MSRFRKAAIVFVCVALSACAGKAGDDDTHGVSGPSAWGSAGTVMHFKHVYIAGQPDAAGFAQAQANGVTAVINLRPADEMDWDEQPVVEAEGMSYYHVPISRSGESLDGEALRRITSIVQEHHEGQVLVHCSSGNRASAWLAAHMVQDHGSDPEEAFAIARHTGLTSSALEARVRTYLERSKAP